MSERLILSLALLGAFSMSALVQAAEGKAEPNDLAGHPSPYLAQHGRDPVRWQVWGPDVIQQARKEGKLLLVSVGYFACHWCHVMQRESYQDEGVAEVMNSAYLPVKVDRELEPALDAHLIEFAKAVRGNAGWPLNVFITPSGYPLTAFTYMPRDMFADTLRSVDERWKSEPTELERLAKDAAAQIAAARPPPAGEPVDAIKAATLIVAFRSQAMAMADLEHGGFGDSAKFPSVPQLVALLELNAKEPDAEITAFIADTLDKMATRGLRDRLGGGFFRYTVDTEWRVPHFEKMLYDNAQLARAYLRAADVYDSERWRRIAFDTLDFMQAELWNDDLGPGEGAYMASLSSVDADDVEGGYYLWTEADLERALSSDERDVARIAFGFGGPSALEHGMLPTHAVPVSTVAERLNLSPQIAQQRLDSSAAKLDAERKRRSLPVDDKLLAGWNGLALSALSAAVKAPGGQRFAPTAQRLAGFLTDRLWDGKALSRAAAAGGSASLEDYALVARGLVDWHLAAQAVDGIEAGNERLLDVALAVARRAFDDFHGPDGWRLDAGSLIPMAPGEAMLSDVSLPSASATLIGAGLDAARLNKDAAFEQRMSSVLAVGSVQLQEIPYLYATQITVLNDPRNRP